MFRRRKFEETFDPNIVIEARGPDMVRYRRLTDGRRWEVHGTCDRRGDCLIGYTIPGYGIIRTKDDLAAACEAVGSDRLVSVMDVPVTPEFDLCCGVDRFRYVNLEPA